MRNEVLDGSLVEGSKHEERTINPSSREERPPALRVYGTCPVTVKGFTAKKEAQIKQKGRCFSANGALQTSTLLIRQSHLDSILSTKMNMRRVKGLTCYYASSPRVRVKEKIIQ